MSRGRDARNATIEVFGDRWSLLVHSIVESLVWPDAVVDVAEAGGLHR
jgi:hypothetical protein